MPCRIVTLQSITGASIVAEIQLICELYNPSHRDSNAKPAGESQRSLLGYDNPIP